MSALKEVNFARVVGTRQRNNLLMRLSLKLSRVGRVAEDALFWREAKWLLIVYLIYTPPMVWNSFVAPYYGPYVVSAPLMFALQGESLECYFILLFNRTCHAHPAHSYLLTRSFLIPSPNKLNTMLLVIALVTHVLAVRTKPGVFLFTVTF